MGYKLSKEEKIRLFNGDGSWRTYDAGGKLPHLTMSDGPHGLRKQDEENYADLNKSRIATCFPTASAIACSFNRKLLYLLGQSIAKEALEQGVDIVLGPGINIKRSPLCGRNFEYYSEDPYLAGSLAAEYIKGMQSLNVGTSLKHFACNNQEKRRQVSNSIVDEKTLSEIYLRAFEIAVKSADPASIMVSYNKVNGGYAASSRFLLTELLRKKWGFKGFVVSDWGACIDAVKCIKAGMDLAMPDSSGYFTRQIEKTYDEDEELKRKLSEANEIILAAAEKYALQDKKKPPKSDNHKVATDMACESAVLLKNDGALPLKEKESITVIGALADKMKFQGGGSSHISTAEYPNAIESLSGEGYEIDYAPGYLLDHTKNRKKKVTEAKLLREEAIEKVKSSVSKKRKVIYFCGLTEEYEGEGFDRENLNLPKDQADLLDEMIKTGAEITVVTFSGSPINLYFEDRVKALLHMYLCGEGCGEAVAQLLSGKVSPSGKLAESFPLNVEDTPCFGLFATEDDNVYYKEGCYVGYRHYEGRDIAVRHEFGFGLSYTDFEYSDLKICLSEGKLSFKIKNIGKTYGGEIAQVYIERKCSSYKELRGFEKVFLNPGEEKEVEVSLDDNSFKEYDTALHGFKINPGKYRINVGRSVKNIVLYDDVEIAEDFCFTEIAPEKDKDTNGYKPDENLYREFFEKTEITPRKKGTFTSADCLGDMAKESFFVRGYLSLLEKGIVLTSKGKSKDDPSVKIAISAIKENPLESLISTSGGLIKEGFVKWLVKTANK